MAFRLGSGVSGKSVWPEGLVKESSSCTCSGEFVPQILCPVLGPTIQEGHWDSEAYPEKGSRVLKDLEHKSWEEQPRELGVYSLEKKKAQEALMTLTTISWKEDESRWGSVISHRQQVTGQKKIASISARKVLDALLRFRLWKPCQAISCSGKRYKGVFESLQNVV